MTEGVPRREGISFLFQGTSVTEIGGLEGLPVVSRWLEVGRLGGDRTLDEPLTTRVSSSWQVVDLSTLSQVLAREANAPGRVLRVKVLGRTGLPLIRLLSVQERGGEKPCSEVGCRSG